MKYILAGLLFLPTLVLADWYGIIGAGQTRFPTYFGSGQWQQVDQGFGFAVEETSPSWSIGLGRRLGETAAVELSYSDLGRYNSFARYTSDASYSAQCSESCDPTHTGWHHGKTKVLEVSLVKEWKHLFGRAGLGYHDTRFTVDMTTEPENTQGRGIAHYEEDTRIGSFSDK